MLIFILTFSLVAVSGYRVNEILEMAHQRLSTILVGGAACIIVSIFVCPVWAGEDLHNMIVRNIEKLAAFFEGTFSVLRLIFNYNIVNYLNQDIKVLTD